MAARGPDRDEGGAVAVIVAIFGVALLMVAALVVDIAQARLDRQASKSATDASVMAGLKSADGGSSDVFTLRGVCGALSFLRANEPKLSGLADGICASGWTTDATVCDPTNPSASLANYTGTTTSGEVTYDVQIKAPYQVTEGSFPEESYGTLANDAGATGMNGCDQLAVIITKTRDPLFAAVVTDDPMVTTIRSVGRVVLEEGDTAPALLLLERTECNVLSVGSSGSGAGSRIWVYGNADTPGSIHADTAATGDCSNSNDKRVFQGNQAGGIVAYGSTDGDGGLITSYAVSRGVDAGTVSDGVANVYGTTALDDSTSGSTTGPVGRSQIGRKPVDQRYRAGVQSAIGGAKAVWDLTPGSLPSDWTQVGCTPDPVVLNALDSTSKLYVQCPEASGITLTGPVVLKAGEIVFNGFVSGSNISMPNARRVYISNRKKTGVQNSANALTLSNNNAFCVTALVCDVASPTTGRCTTSAVSTSARLFVLHGNIKSTGGGLLRLCNTTVYLLGGQDDGCVPSTDGTLPTATPCGTGTSTGTGQITASGHADWTAPNAYAGLIPEADQTSAWAGGEDLSLWAESAITSSDKYVLGGGGSLSVAGVFFTPNARPFQLNGSASQQLDNAQFITRTFAVGGGAQLNMRVDPNNAITLPKLESYLVR